jgi:hypothetical protein
MSLGFNDLKIDIEYVYIGLALVTSVILSMEGALLFSQKVTREKTVQ